MALTLSQYLHGMVVGAPDGQILVFQGELDPARRQATRARDQAKKRGAAATAAAASGGGAGAAGAKFGQAGRHARTSSTSSVTSARSSIQVSQ